MKSALFTILCCIFFPCLTYSQEPYAGDDLNVVNRAISKFEDQFSRRDRETNVRLLLVMAREYTAPVQQEEIFREAGLLFNQKYNHDTEKADPARAAGYFEKAIAVRHSYRDSMMDARCWLLEEYLALGDRKRFQECVTDLLHVDLEQVLRDEYGASQISLLYENNKSKLKNLKRTVRERYNTEVKPVIAADMARDAFDREGTKGIKSLIDRFQKDDSVMTKLLLYQLHGFQKGWTGEIQ